MCPTMMAEPMAPGRGLPVYQPATDVVEGTCNAPSDCRPSLIRLGLQSDGALQVPSTTSVAGWYTGSPRPGAIGSAIIVGHIDSDSGPGVFYRLKELLRGNQVYVRRSDGTM